MSSPKIKYNDLQLDAINSEEEKVLVTACPGSGKSTSLIGAVAHYLDENPKSNVTVITFTRKAAGELAARLCDYKTVFPCTIHSWSLGELRKLSFTHHFQLNLLQEEDTKEILRTLCKDFRYYNMNEFLMYLYVTGNYNLDISEGTQARFDKIARAYEDYKRKNDLYDFMDLPLYLYDKLVEYNTYIEGVDGLFVDEFQDVDPIQAQVFDRVLAKKFFYIGDERQAIYGFRGADSEIFKNLEGFSKHTLNINYRSGQDIIDFASTLYNIHPAYISNIDTLDYCGDERIIGIRGVSGEVVVCKEMGLAHNLTTGNVTRSIAFLKDYLIKKEPFILCRSNRLVKMVKGMGYNAVSTIHQAKGLEYENVLVIDFALEGEEELNIGYVACTRAKDTLVVAGADDVESALSRVKISRKGF